MTVLNPSPNSTSIQPWWKSLWRHHSPNRWKHTLWLVRHDRLLTNEMKLRRHLSSEATCTLCDHPCETTIHALRDCYRAQRIW
ncbi:hypothetical protein HYC85_025615 [Camellia sinensis]|uniref:Reverse transcriptase zinc-binding domain-containing protein n=1 Tax=Camellia sinensis TaxID=4442 RepID=A0A7J7GBI6_CAMSI|nr:hypothetical protein HYC85_025615 [Camellia sinensis]